jgi:acyl carrier protein
MNWIERLLDFFRGSAPQAPPTATLPSNPAKRPVSKEEILEAICEHVARSSKGKWTAGRLVPTARMLDEGYIDSFSLVELLVFIEGTYGIAEIPQVALLGRLATADALAQYVADQTKAPV